MKNLKQIFGSYSKAQEILLLLKDAKPVVRQGFYDNELKQVESFCKRNNLFLAESKFKVKLEEKGFSNRGIRSKNGMKLVYISKDEKAAYLATLAEQTNNHRLLGKLLGYPDCCIDFFMNNFSKDNPNPQLTSTNPYTNINRRHEDKTILSHFPCSSDCKASITLAKSYLKEIESHDKKYADSLIASLQ